MHKYQREFKQDVIPHINSQTNEIVDIIHNYKRPKMNNNESKKPANAGGEGQKDSNL